MRVTVRQPYNLNIQSIPNAIVARETMRTQLAAHEDMVDAEGLTRDGYGMAAFKELKREITFDARLHTADEFVTMARARVNKSADEFHDIAVTLGSHSLLAKVHDHEGRLVHDWPTLLSLAVVMRYTRTRLKSSWSSSQDDILSSR